MWIDVKERLPEVEPGMESEVVHIWGSWDSYDNEHLLGRYDDESNKWHMHPMNHIEIKWPVCWQPLPEPPLTSKEQN